MWTERKTRRLQDGERTPKGGGRGFEEPRTPRTPRTPGGNLGEIEEADIEDDWLEEPEELSQDLRDKMQQAGLGKL
jgi:hypothetical protein